MSRETKIITKSLKEQVYEYLRDQIQQGKFKPGAAINMNETSEKLGISKTPLRDALIQLEMEGFVTIKARKGIYVNDLTKDDIKEYYQIIGALERSALELSFDKFTQNEIDLMQTYNDKMLAALDRDSFNQFHKYNLKFHNVYIDLSQNKVLIKTVNTLKKRLYDFIKKTQCIKEWEYLSIKWHQQLIDLLKKGDVQRAAAEIHDIHWSYKVQKEYIDKYYFE